MQSLDAEYRFKQAGVDICAYPALKDRGELVDVVLADYPGEAWRLQRRGLARLLMLSNKALFRELRKRLFRDNATSLLLAALGLSRDSLLDALLPAIALNASGLHGCDCRERERFEQAVKQLAREGVNVSNDCEGHLGRTLEAMSDSTRLLQRNLKQHAAAAQDLTAQRAHLLSADVLLARPIADLRHYPRYAKAMLVRVERLAANYRRDQEQQAVLEALEEPMSKLVRSVPGALLISPSLCVYEQMLQEFRVSLFAQHLGTSRPVSEKRLRGQWERIAAWYKDTAGRDFERM